MTRGLSICLSLILPHSPRSSADGTTEAGPITTNNRQLAKKLERVVLRLVDRPEIGFTSADLPHPRGEIYVQSDKLALGYYGDAAADRGAFITVGGARGAPSPLHISPPLAAGRWYKTGDLASIDHTGCVRLIDRVSAAVSTRSGCVVTPSRIETLVAERLGGSCERVLVHASAKRESVVVLIVCADGAWCEQRAAPPLVHEPPRGWLLRKGEIANELVAEIAALAQPPLAVHQLAWVVLPPNAWTVENGAVSGELKVRRKRVESAYAVLLDAAHRALL